MKKLLICVYALCFFALGELAASEKYTYDAPSKGTENEHFFEKLITKSHKEKKTFSNIEAYLIKNMSVCHRFQFKFPIKDNVDISTLAKVLQIKAQEAHRFVPSITFSQFIEPSHLGFIRNIKIANNGPLVQEHVLVDNNSMQVVFIEEWALDENGVKHPGGFAAINGIIEEEGKWYFIGAYFYKDAPKESEISDFFKMYRQTFENMMSFIESEDVDQVYSQLAQY